MAIYAFDLVSLWWVCIGFLGSIRVLKGLMGRC